MTLSYTLQQISEVLEQVLDPELSTLLTRINSKDDSPYVTLPNSNDIDLPPTDVARLIATTSNEYGKACRIAGIARAQYKIAVGQYKLKYRISSGSGKNAAERESKAAEASRSEFERMVLLEAVVELAESIESSTRIASESSRRMLLGADQYSKAYSRTESFETSTDRSYSTF
jgi:hypothetical protein